MRIEKKTTLGYIIIGGTMSAMGLQLHDPVKACLVLIFISMSVSHTPSDVPRGAILLNTPPIFTPSQYLVI